MVSNLRMDHRTSGGGTSDDGEAVRRGMAFGWGCWCVKIRRISHREAMEAGGAPSEPGRALDLREHAWIRTTMVEGEVGSAGSVGRRRRRCKGGRGVWTELTWCAQETLVRALFIK